MLDNIEMSPRLLVIGSITNSKALYSDGVRERFGGGLMYGGGAAVKLGMKVTAVTIGAEDIEPGMEQLRSLGVSVNRAPREVSNNFSNDYRGEIRKLQIRSHVLQPLTTTELGQNLSDYEAVILFPLLDEITPDLLEQFSKTTTVMLDPQGMTRVIGERNAEGLYPLSQGHWQTIDAWRGKVGILKLSDDDLRQIQFPELLTTEAEKIKALAENGFPLTVLTCGSKATLVARVGQPVVEVPINQVTVKDAAGAGEVFGVSFLDEYLKTHDPIQAAAFGNACASFKVAGEDFDYEKVKTRAQELLKQVY